MKLDHYTEEAVRLLCALIETPSLSREEEATAQLLVEELAAMGLPAHRIGNNVVSAQPGGEDKPVVVLNSHHDTVRPNVDWTLRPFRATVDGDRISGLGSNDAGGCLVSLLQAYRHYYPQDLPFRLVFIASAEEEVSGAGGLRHALEVLALQPELAIVGEPTQTNLAISEKGLLVLDGMAIGKSGHAAHQYGDNAITAALEDIQRLHRFAFPKTSKLLGPVKLTVTQIDAGTQHNVVPDECRFVVDCRVNEHYSNDEVLATLRDLCTSRLKPRSTHLNSSRIDPIHPIVLRGLALGKTTYGSPTLSDQVFFDCPSVKVGPGDSTRSHQADEYILRSEIRMGVETYIDLLDGLTLSSALG